MRTWYAFDKRSTDPAGQETLSQMDARYTYSFEEFWITWSERWHNNGARIIFSKSMSTAESTLRNKAFTFIYIAVSCDRVLTLTYTACLFINHQQSFIY